MPIFEILGWIEIAHYELLLFGATWFLIGGINQLVVDAIWIGRRVYRQLRYYRKFPRLISAQLARPQSPGLITIFVPTWQEAPVIGAMLKRCRDSWQRGATRYQIYVGCYPNDTSGAAAIMQAINNDPHMQMVICDNAGPTTKADCLNRLWQAMLTDEVASGIQSKAIVLHDAEDYVHEDELAIFDRLIEKAEGVQLPVIPVAVPNSIWISGHYCDEFAVAHGRDLVVREAIGAALPFAGVGCAIDRVTLGRIAVSQRNRPFDDNSLTEDYELGLRIGMQGGRTIMARIRDDNGTLIGTRACFPDTIASAVRQKARWVTGIALAGWDRLGWNNRPAELWMRLHDRSAIFAAILLLVAYACLILTFILILAAYLMDYTMPILSPIFIILLWTNGGLMLWRLCVRAAFVWRIYGWKSALISIPRSIISSVIAIIAARRALSSYIRVCIGQKLVWDKTDHVHFPASLAKHD